MQPNELEAYSKSEFRIRGIYSYKDVSAPLWTMHAWLKCEGNFLMSIVVAKLPINSDSMSPKCWEAFTPLKGMLNKIIKLQYTEKYNCNINNYGNA